MTKQPEILTDRDGAIGWIRINRPARLNAFSRTMRVELEQALQSFEGDAEVRCIILTGVGRAFCTGGDVTVMSELIAAGDAETFDDLVEQGARVVRLIDQMSTPVIAAINGPAAGAGACLALACDLRIASESATIGFGFLRVGLHADWGGSFFLPRLIGLARATEYLMTGEMIGAERADQLGLVNRVVASSELEAVAQTMAGQIAAGPASMVIEMKRTLRKSLNATLPQVLELETEAQRKAFRSPDFREGVTSFMEKRSPKFSRKPNGTHGRESES